MSTVIQESQQPISAKFLQFYKDRTLLAILLSLFAVMFVYGIFFTDNYLTITNFKAIIRDAALYGIMAIGLTFVTLSGNFFFTVPQRNSFHLWCYLCNGNGYWIWFTRPSRKFYGLTSSSSSCGSCEWSYPRIFCWNGR